MEFWGALFLIFPILPDSYQYLHLSVSVFCCAVFFSYLQFSLNVIVFYSFFYSIFVDRLGFCSFMSLDPEVSLRSDAQVFLTIFRDHLVFSDAA